MTRIYGSAELERSPPPLESKKGRKSLPHRYITRPLGKLRYLKTSYFSHPSKPLKPQCLVEPCTNQDAEPFLFRYSVAGHAPSYTLFISTTKTPPLSYTYPGHSLQHPPPPPTMPDFPP